jgi:hypothetical protein
MFVVHVNLAGSGRRSAPGINLVVETVEKLGSSAATLTVKEKSQRGMDQVEHIKYIYATEFPGGSSRRPELTTMPSKTACQLVSESTSV